MVGLGVLWSPREIPVVGLGVLWSPREIPVVGLGVLWSHSQTVRSLWWGWVFSGLPVRSLWWGWVFSGLIPRPRDPCGGVGCSLVSP